MEAKQSKAKQSKAKQSKAKQSKAKQRVLVIAVGLIISTNVYAMDYKQYPRQPYYGEDYSLRKPKPRIEYWDGVVDRHVFKDPEDYLQDQQVLIANLPSKPVIALEVSFQTPQTTLDKLNKRLKSIQYDPTARIIGKSRTPEEVVSQGRGNCFEVARLAMMYLTQEGYNAHIIDVRTKNSKNWHSICAFQEIDGTWSYFSATKDHIGYAPSHAGSMEELVKTQFRDLEDMKVVI